MAVVSKTSSSDNVAPPSQSMDKSPTTSSPDATTAAEVPPSLINGSSSAAAADPVDYFGSSPRSSRQLEFQPSLRSEEYRQLFRLPPEEDSFYCYYSLGFSGFCRLELVPVNIGEGSWGRGYDTEVLRVIYAKGIFHLENAYEWYHGSYMLVS